MFYPCKAKYKETARDFNIIPVYKEYMSDTETPTSIFLKCVGMENRGFLLESIEGSRNLARYSIIGVGCRKSLQLRDGIFSYRDGPEILKQERTSSPMEDIEGILKGYRAYRDENLSHFFGGAVGYLSYDLVKYFENIKLPVNSLDMPEIFLYLTDLVVIFDHLLNRVRIVATVKIDKRMPAGKAYDLSVKMIEDLEEKMMENNAPVSGSGIYSPGDKILPKFEFDSNFKKEDFLGAVEKSKFYITRGDAFQVVLSQRFSVGSYEEPLGIYRALRSINPSPYMYFFNFGDFYVAGASPEPLIKIDGKKVFTCPIAGTRERGATPAEEEVLMNSLLNDRKEIAEHNMLVDLARNDLGRVCRYGSVEVKKYMDIEKYSHVMHLVSRVEGVLNDRSSIYDALRSVFPAGTLSGAPKIRAMQIISELEPDRRGPYGGAVGYFGYDGSLDSCITIRTAVVKEKRVYIQAGAGIVYDSIPENEYEETINKAAALFNALKIMR